MPGIRVDVIGETENEDKTLHPWQKDLRKSMRRSGSRVDMTGALVHFGDADSTKGGEEKMESASLSLTDEEMKYWDAYDTYVASDLLTSLKAVRKLLAERQVETNLSREEYKAAVETYGQLKKILSLSKAEGNSANGAKTEEETRRKKQEVKEAKLRAIEAKHRAKAKKKASRKAKEAARVKAEEEEKERQRIEEEKSFWAREEAKLAAEAEKRKQEKGARMRQSMRLEMEARKSSKLRASIMMGALAEIKHELDSQSENLGPGTDEGAGSDHAKEESNEAAEYIMSDDLEYQLAAYQVDDLGGGSDNNSMPSDMLGAIAEMQHKMDSQLENLGSGTDEEEIAEQTEEESKEAEAEKKKIARYVAREISPT